ncbi:MAG: molybdopterin-dependent oxidoreductase, partial [Anaerolineae bacterium]|nr:molybdopterin-dependent oxidoreductase [Anaerolineae bacterium]
GNMQQITWGEAVTDAAAKIKAAGSDIAAIAGSQMSNEDLWVLRELLARSGSKRLGTWIPTHTGADLVAEVGVGYGTNLGSLGKGDAVLIIASDLEEEVPMWRLRLKQAHDRGAMVVVANARPTRMDDFASQVVRYPSGHAAHFMHNLKSENADLAKQLTEATNLIILTGAEGLTLAGSRALMQAAANFLIDSRHMGRANNGLISTFPGPNWMGQHYLGYSPETTLDITQKPPKVLIIAQAEILMDDPAAAKWLSQVETIIALKLFVDDGANKYAHLLLPIQSFAERDGTFTSGERRVQRFYTAQGPMGEALPAWQVLARLNEKLDYSKPKVSAAAVMLDITKTIPAFAGCSYKEISKVERQFPDVGGRDLYYGGTAYQNKGGLGVQIKTAADNGQSVASDDVQLSDAPKAGSGQMLVVPTTRLYNRESIFQPSTLVHPRVLMPYAEINSADAAKLGISSGDVVEISIADITRVRVKAHVNGGAPEGSVVLPRHLTATAVPLTITLGEVSKV